MRTPFQYAVAGKEAYSYVPLTHAIPVLQVDKVIVRTIQTIEHNYTRDPGDPNYEDPNYPNGIFKVIPVLLGSDNNVDFTEVVTPDSGSECTWKNIGGYGGDPGDWARQNYSPWVWSLSYGSGNLQTAVAFKVALRFQTPDTNTVACFRARADVGIDRRPIQTVGCSSQLVLSSSTGFDHYRLTRPITPHVSTGHLRATFAVDDHVEQGGAADVVPCWFYRNEPSDPTDWNHGGDLLSSYTSTKVTKVTDPVQLSNLEQYAQIAFGFGIKRSGGSSGDVVAASVRGQFTLY